MLKVLIWRSLWRGSIDAAGRGGLNVLRIAIVHGYLLSDTGSNIYVANLTAGLADRGHEVFLFCQEQQPRRFGFIDECYDFEADNKRFFPVFDGRRAGIGKVRLFRPHIGRLLPVYVPDDYVGFEAREFHLLSAAEIENYVAQTAAAIRAVYEEFGFDCLQANHLIASPAAARRAVADMGVPYHVTIHGSALNYSVKRSSALNPLAVYGLERAASVSASSDFLGRQLNDYLRSVNREPVEVRTIYPGVELSLFKPFDDREAQIGAFRREMAERPAIGKNAGQKRALRAVVAGGDPILIDEELGAPPAYERRAPDSDLADMLARIDWKKERVGVFIGKYLAAKGLHACVLAAPIIFSESPGTTILAVGFSDTRESFEALLTALVAGRKDVLLRLVDRIEASIEPKVGGRFLKKLDEEGKLSDYLEKAARVDLIEKFLFTGPLGHDELARLLPAADFTLSPSIFPEAFGMVAIEALACGVYPIVTDDFGMAEIAGLVEEMAAGPGRLEPSLKLNDDFVKTLARAAKACLRRAPFVEPAGKRAAHEFVAKRFSWARVVDDYIDVFTGSKERAA